MKVYKAANLSLLLHLFLSVMKGASEPVREYRPNDDINKAEILSLKTMLSSVQASLITSVGLIQDQIDQFGNSYLEKVDARLTAHDIKLSSIDENVKNIQERAHVWDSFQHHATSWADLMTTVESKIDHISRAQSEQHSQVDGKLSRLQSAMSLELEQINERVTIMENKFRSISTKQDEVIESVKNVQEKVNNLIKIRSRSPRQHSVSPSGDIESSHKNKSLTSPLRSSQHHHICRDVKGKIEGIDTKIDHVYQRLKNIGSNTTLVSSSDSNLLDDGNDYFTDNIDHDLERVLFDNQDGVSHTAPSQSSKKQFFKILRRITLPFKKANKRLREMEDIRHRFTTSLDQMRMIVNTLMVDSDRRYNEFYNMTMEMFDQQHNSLQSYERQFASLQQCCQGTASDLSGFDARTHSAFTRLENLINVEEEGGGVIASPTISSSRSREQLRFDTNRIVAILKEHEKILVDGFDQNRFCKIKKRRASFNSHQNVKVHNNITIASNSSNSSLVVPDTTTSPPPTFDEPTSETNNLGLVGNTTPRSHLKQSHFDPSIAKSSAVTESDPVVSTPLQINLEFRNEEDLSDISQAAQVKTCEDLLKAGFLDNKVYTVEIPPDSHNQRGLQQEVGHDFRHRLCDQQTSGGGWTVIQQRGAFDEFHENFTKSWEEYKYGFGNFYGEFWYGNDLIHRLTNDIPTVIRIELSDFDGNHAFAEYSKFRIEDENNNYRLWVGDYYGNATDSFSVHNGYYFSTVDKNNDEAPSCCPCAPSYGGGWWFYSCFESNLNGEYQEDPEDNDYYHGIIWELWRGDYSLKTSKMMIRSKAFHDVANLDPQNNMNNEVY